MRDNQFQTCSQISKSTTTTKNTISPESKCNRAGARENGRALRVNKWSRTLCFDRLKSSLSLYCFSCSYSYANLGKLLKRKSSQCFTYPDV